MKQPKLQPNEPPEEKYSSHNLFLSYKTRNKQARQMDTFTLITSDLLLINIMDKDFPEKPYLKDIELTESNDDASMIHPTASLFVTSLQEASPTNNPAPPMSPERMDTAAVGKPVDPNHFPTQLYKMLDEIDNSQGAAAETVAGRTFVSIVSWQPHGKCFLIHDEDLFSKYVLPKYFCRLKFTSFQRQLHFHGFKRLCKQGMPSVVLCIGGLFGLTNSLFFVMNHRARQRSLLPRPFRKGHARSCHLHREDQEYEGLARSQEEVSGSRT